MKDFLHRLNEIDRRDFIAYSAKAFLGVGLLPFAAQTQALASMAGPTRPRAKSVIYLYMAGGMSHLDTFDTKPGSAVQGSTKTIKSNVDGIRVSAHFKRTAQLMDKIAVVNSMSSNQGAHEEGRYFLHSSYVKRGTIVHPGMGSWIGKLQGPRNPSLPSIVHVGTVNPGGSNGFLEPRYAPLVIGNPEEGLKNSNMRAEVTEDEFHETLNLTRSFDQEFHRRYPQRKVQAYTDMYDDAVRLMKSEDLAAFSLENEPKELRKAYGENAFGQGCLLARRLVEHDVRFVEVSLGGWDTHTNNFERVEENATILDHALASLLGDLSRRGLLEETMVVVGTEFGRTPDINDNEGRDHSPTAFSCLLAGGGIRGGQVYGKTDEKGKFVVENKVEIPDFNATIAYGLGIPLEKTIYSESGRPFTVADKGKPVMDLFG